MILTVLFVLLVVSCKTDGEAYMAITYQTEETVEYINIIDDSAHNGIYADEENNQIYCQKGTDLVVKLPVETQWNENFNTANIEMEVEAICALGQEKFDQFLQPFNLIQLP